MSEKPKGRKPTPDDLFTVRCKSMIGASFVGRSPEDKRLNEFVLEVMKMGEERGLMWSEIFLVGCELTLIGAENSYTIPERKWEVN